MVQMLQNTCLHTANRDSANATNLVDVLERETEGLSRAFVPVKVGGPFDHVVTLEARDGDERDLVRVVTNFLEVRRDLLNDFIIPGLGVLRCGGIHLWKFQTINKTISTRSTNLVTAADHLLDSKGEGKQGVLTGLAILGNTSLKATSCGINDENSTVSLRGASDHVLDEVTVTGSINDSAVVFGGLEFPQGNVDGDATLTLGLELVEHPS
ncbi:translation elongation factor 1-alpha, partial [Striga asiatica]